MTLFEIIDGHLEPLIFEEPCARRSDPPTAHAAAARVNPTGTRARALLALNAVAEGLTDFELAARTGVGQTSIGVRRKELQRAGLVEPTEHRRPSPSGTPALVWRITEAGSREARRVASEAR